MNGSLLIADGNVVQELEMKSASEWVVRKIIDDTPYQKRSYDMRKQFGDGRARDSKGRTMAVNCASIPIDELSALLLQDDPDAVAWWKDKNDRKALRRLLERYPYWRISSASI